MGYPVYYNGILCKGLQIEYEAKARAAEERREERACACARSGCVSLAARICPLPCLPPPPARSSTPNAHNQSHP